MPRFDVITLMPELFGPHLSHGVTRRAFESGAVDVRLWPLREHASGPYRRVDDRPFGGGPGMVMLAEPLHRCIQAIRADRAAQDGARLIHFTPTGQALTQALVRELAQGPGALLLCGRYEGVDHRIREHLVDGEVSVGDVVLAGGEVAACLIVEAVVRLLPGAMGNAESPVGESFGASGLLEEPQFTRPADFRGWSVPEVLRSGDHARIGRWRRAAALRRTRERRPDLLDRDLTPDERALLEEFPDA